MTTSYSYFYSHYNCFTRRFLQFFLPFIFTVDICEEQKPCKNGAGCESSGDSYICKCAEGFQGPTCEEGNGINIAEQTEVQ